MRNRRYLFAAMVSGRKAERQFWLIGWPKHAMFVPSLAIWTAESMTTIATNAEAELVRTAIVATWFGSRRLFE